MIFDFLEILTKIRYVFRKEKKQESHSPLLAETYLVSKLPTNGPLERNSERTEAGVRELHCPSSPGPREGCCMQCGLPTHRLDFISRLV